MPSWSELQAHLRQRFVLLTDEPAELAVGFRLELRPGQTAAQVVRGYHEVHDQESWLHARTDVGPAEFLDPTVALTRNATLMVGALALREGRYIVHQSWPLRTLDFAELDRGLQYLALGAATLQELAHASAPPPAGQDAAANAAPLDTPAAPLGPNRHFSD